MATLTKLADLGDRDVLDELLERIAQLEAQEGPGYGPCLKFYTRLATRIQDQSDEGRHNVYHQRNRI